MLKCLSYELSGISGLVEGEVWEAVSAHHVEVYIKVARALWKVGPGEGARNIVLDEVFRP